uniref:Amino acid transporter transmembrane domain-containing protein n=1 Tax=Odontella aurita TaxID=265563 RepID=A0A7S4HPN4_9STRA|mmetsp:Transcript_13145/g.38694  ORF Transcript_13145/g.38694 Transcript_13145/m.38694 type:complete len:548 (+) Transcript_13145:198-1841(+)
MAASNQTSGEGPGGGSFSPLVMACFTLNYIVGTGFLALPWAFYQAGWLLSGAVLVGVCAAANVGSDYILSAMARAERIVQSRDQSVVGEDSNGVSGRESVISLTDLSHDENTSLVQKSPEDDSPAVSCEGGENATSSADTYGTVPPSRQMNEFDDDTAGCSEAGPLLVGKRMIDLPELCRLFLGVWGFRGYGFCVSYYLYGALWSFTSVFGSALALNLPASLQGGDTYAMSVFIFALIVGPMSFMDLDEQKAVQVVLSGGRIVMIILMIITPLIAALCTLDMGTPHFDDQTSPMGAPATSAGGISRMMPVVVYAAIFHFSIPSLAEEVTDKARVGEVFGLTFILCGTLYTFIGGIGAWYFGAGIEQSANLNWGPYHGGTGRLIPGGGENGGEDLWVDVAFWAKALSKFVVMFPALNVISAFPLHTFSLGRSLMGIYYGENVHKAEKNRRIKSVFRAISCVPPLIGGLFVRDLGTITGFAGLAGLAIAFCFPAMLYIGSERAMKDRFGASAPLRTRYQRFGSSSLIAAGVLAFGTVSIVVVFFSLILT